MGLAFDFEADIVGGLLDATIAAAATAVFGGAWVIVATARAASTASIFVAGVVVFFVAITTAMTSFTAAGVGIAVCFRRAVTVAASSAPTLVAATFTARGAFAVIFAMAATTI